VQRVFEKCSAIYVLMELHPSQIVCCWGISEMFRVTVFDGGLLSNCENCGHGITYTTSPVIVVVF